MVVLALKRILDSGFEEALVRLPKALRAEGFALLNEVDVKDTLQEKLGVAFREYRILDVCNPSLAHEALSADLDLGMMVPCRVVVYEADNGRAVVQAVDPTALVAVHESPRVRELAATVRGKLARVLDALDSRGSRALRVSELMNQDLFSLPPSASAKEAQ